MMIADLAAENYPITRPWVATEMVILAEARKLVSNNWKVLCRLEFDQKSREMYPRSSAR